MTDEYPIRFAAQLRQHLRALRKRHGLTQAQVGSLVGVSQVRIAEIEANPGLVSFDQLMQVFSALGVTLFLHEDISLLAAPKKSGKLRVTKPGDKKPSKNSPGYPLTFTQSRPKKSPALSPDYSVRLPSGSWCTTDLRAGPKKNATGELLIPGAAVDGKILDKRRELNPDKNVQPASRGHFVVRPKKGAW